MTPAAHPPGERWEIADAMECGVVVVGTDTVVAVMGDPMEDATPEDWRRLPLVAAAPDMLAALDALMAPLRAALDDCVRVDPG